jgi:hypothetical protein
MNDRARPAPARRRTSVSAENPKQHVGAVTKGLAKPSDSEASNWLSPLPTVAERCLGSGNQASDRRLMVGLLS